MQGLLVVLNIEPQVTYAPSSIFRVTFIIKVPPKRRYVTIRTMSHLSR